MFEFLIRYTKIPLYSAFIVSKETEKELEKTGIKDFEDEYHTTICYSKKPVQIKKYLLEKRDFNIPPFSAKIIDWDIFESEKYGRCLVLKLDCKKCKEEFEKFQQKGASFDYDKYIPHLTLCYDLPYDIDPKEVFEQVKDLEIIFDKIRFEEIDEEKYSKN